MNGNLRVLHVISYARSGSTILGLVLAQYKQTVFLGEVSLLFKYNWDRNCSCTHHKETHMSQCPVWGPVLKKVKIILKQYSFWDENEECFKKHIRGSFLRKACKQMKKGNHGPELLATMEVIKTVHEESSRIEQAKVVIDSSKNLNYMQILKYCYGNDYFPLYLLRDPRAVVYSSRKSPSIIGRRKALSIKRSARVAFGWAVKNVLIQKHAGLKKGDDQMLLYEDWCKNPRSITNRLMERLFERNDLNTPFTDKNTVVVEPEHCHSFSGNRSRSSSGEISIKQVTSWEKKLKKRFQISAKIASYPVFQKYYS